MTVNPTHRHQAEIPMKPESSVATGTAAALPEPVTKTADCCQEQVRWGQGWVSCQAGPHPELPSPLPESRGSVRPQQGQGLICQRGLGRGAHSGSLPTPCSPVLPALTTLSPLQEVCGSLAWYLLCLVTEGACISAQPGSKGEGAVQAHAHTRCSERPPLLVKVVVMLLPLGGPREHSPVGMRWVSLATC